MIIYFVRHASAGEPVKNPHKDTRRPLDSDGAKQAVAVGRFLASINVHVDAILTSPLKRAMQTAALVGNEIGHEGTLVRHDALRPEATWTDFRHLLDEHKKAEALMVVGHNPNLPEFFAKIITPGGGRPQMYLKKGSVAKVEMVQRGGELQWLITPKIVRALQTSSKSSHKPKTR